jgi:hypothetical protein
MIDGPRMASPGGERSFAATHRGDAVAPRDDIRVGVAFGQNCQRPMDGQSSPGGHPRHPPSPDGTAD